VAENAAIGAVAGVFTTTDLDGDKNHTYTFVAGGADNNKFTISNAQLKTAAVFDFEVKNSYEIRVRTTDSGGRSFDKTFTVRVLDVDEQATDIKLSNQSVLENKSIGTVVGALSAVYGKNASNVDIIKPATFKLVSGFNSTDNGSFSIAGTELRTAAVFDYEAKRNYLIRIRAENTSNAAVFAEKSFGINVLDAADIPGKPTGLTATPDNQCVKLTWTEPANNGAEIRNYVVEKSTDSGVTWQNATTVTAPAASFTIPVRTEHFFRVAAVNDIGRGPNSDSVEATVCECEEEVDGGGASAVVSTCAECDKDGGGADSGLDADGCDTDNEPAPPPPDPGTKYCTSLGECVSYTGIGTPLTSPFFFVVSDIDLNSDCAKCPIPCAATTLTALDAATGEACDYEIPRLGVMDGTGVYSRIYTGPPTASNLGSIRVECVDGAHVILSVTCQERKCQATTHTSGLCTYSVPAMSPKDPPISLETTTLGFTGAVKATCTSGNLSFVEERRCVENPCEAGEHTSGGCIFTYPELLGGGQGALTIKNKFTHTGGGTVTCNKGVVAFSNVTCASAPPPPSLSGAAGNGSAVLTWTISSNSTVESFEINWAIDANFTQGAQTKIVFDRNQRIDTIGIQNEEITYARIRAVASNGLKSAWSNVVELLGCGPPAPPTWVSFQQTIGFPHGYVTFSVSGPQGSFGEPISLSVEYSIGNAAFVALGGVISTWNSLITEKIPGISATDSRDVRLRIKAQGKDCGISYSEIKIYARAHSAFRVTRAVPTTAACSNSIDVTWGVPTSEANRPRRGYTIECSAWSGIFWGDYVSDGVTHFGSSGRYKAPKPGGRQYRCRVKANNADGTTTTTINVAGTGSVRTSGDTPGPVTITSIYNVTANSAIVKWDRPSNTTPTISRYIIVVREKPSLNTVIFTDQTNPLPAPTPLTLTNLKPGTAYEVVVYAENNCTSGPLSDEARNALTWSPFTTLGANQATALPKAPESCTAKFTVNEFLLTWLPPSAPAGLPILSYKITAQRFAPGDIFGVDVVETREYTLAHNKDRQTQIFNATGLQNVCGENYYFVIRAVNSVGISDILDYCRPSAKNPCAGCQPPIEPLRSGNCEFTFDTTIAPGATKNVTNTNTVSYTGTATVRCNGSTPVLENVTCVEKQPGPCTMTNVFWNGCEFAFSGQLANGAYSPTPTDPWRPGGGPQYKPTITEGRTGRARVQCLNGVAAIEEDTAECNLKETECVVGILKSPDGNCSYPFNVTLKVGETAGPVGNTAGGYNGIASVRCLQTGPVLENVECAPLPANCVAGVLTYTAPIPTDPKNWSAVSGCKFDFTGTTITAGGQTALSQNTQFGYRGTARAFCASNGTVSLTDVTCVPCSCDGRACFYEWNVPSTGAALNWNLIQMADGRFGDRGLCDMAANACPFVLTASQRKTMKIFSSDPRDITDSTRRSGTVGSILCPSVAHPCGAEKKTLSDGCTFDFRSMMAGETIEVNTTPDSANNGVAKRTCNADGSVTDTLISCESGCPASRYTPGITCYFDFPAMRFGEVLEVNNSNPNYTGRMRRICTREEVIHSETAGCFNISGCAGICALQLYQRTDGQLLWLRLDRTTCDGQQLVGGCFCQPPPTAGYAVGVVITRSDLCVN